MRVTAVVTDMTMVTNDFLCTLLVGRRTGAGNAKGGMRHFCMSVGSEQSTL